MPHSCTFKTAHVTVTDSAVALFDTILDEEHDYYGSVKNIGEDDVFIGCATVTSECGYQLSTDEELKIEFWDSSDSLSAICAEGESVSVCWFLAAYG